MTFHDYLLKNLEMTVMIEVSVNDIKTQYNCWNWFHAISQLHLIANDGSIGHIIHGGKITENEDGSISYESQYHPKNCVLNFYFGGIKN